MQNQNTDLTYNFSITFEKATRRVVATCGDLIVYRQVAGPHEPLTFEKVTEAMKHVMEVWFTQEAITNVTGFKS